MYRISVIAVGTLKEVYWRDARDEYCERMKPYARLSLMEVGETRFSHATDRDRVIKSEGERLARVIPHGAYVIALDSTGMVCSSEQFAEQIRREGGGGRAICFVIGGPLGLSNELLKKAHETLSLSRLTLTHQLARVVLFEQLYRAMTITHKKIYHY